MASTRTAKSNIIPQLQPLAIPIGDAKPLPGNPRRGEVDAIARSLDKFGQRKPIVLKADGTTEAGNHTLLAARKLGWTEIAAVTCDDDDATAKAFALADNRTGDLGIYDNLDLLTMILDVKSEEDAALLAATSYTDDDLVKLLAAQQPEPATVQADPEDIPDVDEDGPQITQVGDVWDLGPHRLICGDSTKRDTYDALLGDERPELLLTDPPYGVAYNASNSEKRAILGDLSQAAIPVGLAASIEYLDDDARLIVFGGSDQFAMYLNLFDFHLRQTPRLIVWKKEGFILRHHGFHSQYEFAYYGWRGKGGQVWIGERTVSDVWEIARKKETNHPTEKPVALYEIPAMHLAPVGALVLDPFSGSGVTVMACHTTGRVARVIDLDPYYCDVICKRWQRVSGVLPVRRSTGEAVDFLG